MLISKLKFALRKSHQSGEKIMKLFLIGAIRMLHESHSFPNKNAVFVHNESIACAQISK